VAVLKVAGYERWLEVANVLQTKGNRGIVKPPLPVAAAILGRGYGDDILFLAILHLHVLATILGIARNLRHGRRVVKRIVQDQIECGPRSDFPRMRTVQTGGRISSRR